MTLKSVEQNLDIANLKADINMRQRAAIFGITNPCGTLNENAKRINGPKLLEKNEDEQHWPGDRSHFEIDRDQILFNPAFPRLARKTQVFTGSKKTAYRNRLTHTLDVAQLSRSIAHKKGLNVDLAEAIAYGHDVGHTPFGHAGEKALNLCLYEYFARKAIGIDSPPIIGGIIGSRTHEQIIDGIKNSRTHDQKHSDYSIWHLVQQLASIDPVLSPELLPTEDSIRNFLKPELFNNLVKASVLQIQNEKCFFNDVLNWDHMPTGKYKPQIEFMLQPGKRELFAHYTHSLRQLLCFRRADKSHVDLTRQTAYGILSHSWRGAYDNFRLYSKDIPQGSIELTKDDDETPEAFVVRMADNISFLNSDIIDATEAGILEWNKLKKEDKKLFDSLIDNTAEISDFPSPSQCLQCCENGFSFSANTPHYTLSGIIEEINNNVIAEYVYPFLVPRQESAERIIRELFWFYCPSNDVKRSVEKSARKKYEQFNADRWGKKNIIDISNPRLAADYVAWLTDDEAIAIHSALFAPEHASWERYFIDVKDE